MRLQKTRAKLRPLSCLFFTFAFAAFSGCGIDSTPAISAPYAYSQASMLYSFKHSMATATSQGVLGYDILYRFYTNTDAMQSDFDSIENYKESLPTGVYSKMVQTMGYQRITPQDFSQDWLVNLGAFNGSAAHNSNLSAYDANISLDFTVDLSEVKLTIFDGVHSADSILIFRGTEGSTANQGKEFDEIYLTDSDVKRTSDTTTVYLQAYVFAIGSDDLISFIYSPPSFLGSTSITCKVFAASP
jgi:hypothetical protein